MKGSGFTLSKVTLWFPFRKPYYWSFIWKIQIKEEDGFYPFPISLYSTHSIHACRVSFVDPVKGCRFARRAPLAHFAAPHVTCREP